MPEHVHPSAQFASDWRYIAVVLVAPWTIIAGSVVFFVLAAASLRDTRFDAPALTIALLLAAAASLLMIARNLIRDIFRVMDGGLQPEEAEVVNEKNRRRES